MCFFLYVLFGALVDLCCEHVLLFWCVSFIFAVNVLLFWCVSFIFAVNVFGSNAAQSVVSVPRADPVQLIIVGWKKQNRAHQKIVFKLGMKITLFRFWLRRMLHHQELLSKYLEHLLN